jgi:hypothetical protein
MIEADNQPVKMCVSHSLFILSGKSILCHHCVKAVLPIAQASNLYFIVYYQWLNLVPGTGLNSRMDKGFAWVWGIVFVPHKNFHFGVSRAQQLRSGKAGQISFVSLFSISCWLWLYYGWLAGTAWSCSAVRKMSRNPFFNVSSPPPWVTAFTVCV